jgi:hypothetical protein
MEDLLIPYLYWEGVDRFQKPMAGRLVVSGVNLGR